MQTGVSGDMILGALFDLGLDFQAWSAKIRGLKIPDLKMHVEKVSKQGIMASKFHVEIPEEHAHRSLAAIGEIITGSDLSAGVKSSAMAVFTRLAEVEGKIHGVPADEVHFHEVGALDAIVDIVGACVGFEMLD